MSTSQWFAEFERQEAMREERLDIIRAKMHAQKCEHKITFAGPDIPRVYGSWASEVCRDCGAWRTMTHRTLNIDGTLNATQYHYSEWHRADELDAALEPDDER